MDFTVGLGLYTAGIATATLIHRVVQSRKDRARILVETNPGAISRDPHLEPGAKMLVKVSNQGRRQVTIAATGWKLANEHAGKNMTVLDPYLPVELAEGKSHTTYADFDEVVAMGPENIEYAFARDAVDQLYWSRRWPFAIPGTFVAKLRLAWGRRVHRLPKR